jgi:hypothetical protein
MNIPRMGCLVSLMILGPMLAFATYMTVTEKRAPATQASSPPPEPVQTAEEKRQALAEYMSKSAYDTLDVIRSQARDPSSAQFRNVWAMEDMAVCGEVNARNGFGGYSGFVPFFGIGTAVYTAESGGEKFFAENYSRHCKGEKLVEIPVR